VRVVRSRRTSLSCAPAALARAVFVEQTRNYLDVFRIPRTDPGELLSRIRTTGWENFERAAAQGAGVICASAHLGPIGLVGQMLLAHGYRVAMPLETERGDMQRAINRARRALGLEFIPIESALGLRRVLREGKVLGFLADRAVTGIGERVPFFGRDALLPSAHVAFAMRSGAALVPAFAGHEGDALTASFEPPLEIPRTGDRDADLREGVRRWAQVLEKHVRCAPEQWSVFEKVWD
jgi:KDO2-lipid IV(A) lauroyltransferase